jgi:SAM-dependent methyltransferase
MPDKSSEHLASAYRDWDQRWTVAEERGRWREPEPFIRHLVPLLRQRGLTRVLDVGCGVGRHTLYLAGEGFACIGLDASAAGLEFARDQARAAGLAIDFRDAVFYSLPVDDASADCIVAWNVIYHGDGSIAQRAIDEMHRVLAPGGLIVGTMLSKRNVNFGVGRQVQPDTFVVDGADTDKVHPHFYTDAAGLLALHRGFEALELRDREQGPGAYHWEFVFERTS